MRLVDFLYIKRTSHTHTRKVRKTASDRSASAGDRFLSEPFPGFECVRASVRVRMCSTGNVNAALFVNCELPRCTHNFALDYASGAHLARARAKCNRCTESDSLVKSYASRVRGCGFTSIRIEWFRSFDAPIDKSDSKTIRVAMSSVQSA